MKKKTLIISLILEAGLLILLAILLKQPTKLFNIITFPFEQIAIGLKAIANTGAIGNGLALALLVGISLLPIVLTLQNRHGNVPLLEKAVLYILSCVIFLAIFGMINPQIFCSYIQESILDGVKSTMSLTVLSVLIVYIILKLNRLFLYSTNDRLLAYLSLVLYALCFFICGVATMQIFNEANELFSSAQNIIEKSIYILRLLVILTPYVFEIVIISQLLDLIKSSHTDEEAQIVSNADRLSKSCCVALGGITASTAVINLVQLLFMRYISNISSSVNIPIFSIVFACIILLVSRLIMENKKLRDDNNLFI